MDWEFVRRTSASLGTLRMTGLALALAREITGARIPQPAQTIADADPSVPPLVAEIRARSERGLEAPGFLGSARFQFVLRERTRDRLAFALRHAVTPNMDDLGVAALPVESRWLYHLLRPLRLIRKWTSTAGDA
jgi:hypothetical protein